MPARRTEGIDRNSAVSLPLATNVIFRRKRCDDLCLPALVILALMSLYPSSAAWAQAAGSNGKNCRMEQQCRWENFKKICSWVKVCR